MHYKLITPFRGLAGAVTSVEVREILKGGDVLAARRESPTDSTIHSFVLVARLCGLDLKEVEEMDVRDIEAIGKFISEIQESPKTEAAAPALPTA